MCAVTVFVAADDAVAAFAAGDTGTVIDGTVFIARHIARNVL